MIIDGYKSIIDDEYLNFKTILRKIVKNADADPDVSDIDMELFKLHLIDLYEEFTDIIEEC